MQPSTPQRPVMDISAPQRTKGAGANGRPSSMPGSRDGGVATPPESRSQPSNAVPVKNDTELFEKSAPSLPVREAPNSAKTEASTGNSLDTAINADNPPAEKQPAPAAPPSISRDNDKSPLPAGAITVAVLLMLVLSAVAVMIYLKSQ